MENAVIYARFSSHNQREESIEGQIRECKNYAKTHHLSIVNTYADRAISGRTDNRPSFQRMIADAANGGFSYVIVYSLDRFSRDRYDAAVYKRQLKLCGVKVISAKENISDDPAGILMESLLEGLAEYYSAELAQKIKRGMTENALKCKWASGHPPFGYRINPTTRMLELDPQTAPAAKTIFKLYSQGVRLTEISKQLNEQGYLTKTGGKFGKNSYKSMFKNEIYIGTFKWGEIEIKKGVPAMIDEELFDICRQRQNAAKHSKTAQETARTSDRYLLSGKLFCGLCGAPMIGVSGTARNGTLMRYYTCRNRRRKTGTCDMKNFSASYLEGLIVDTIIRTITNNEVLNGVIENVVALSKNEVDRTHLESLEKERAQEEKKLNKLLDVFLSSDEDVGDIIRRKKSDLEKRIKELDYAIALEENRIDKMSFSRDGVEFYVRYWIKEAEENRNEKAQEIFINAFLRKATIQKEKDGTYSVLLELKISPNPPNPSTTADGDHALGGSQNSSLVGLCRIMANHNIYIDTNCCVYILIGLS